MARPVFQASYKEVSGNVAAPSFNRSLSIANGDILLIFAGARSTLVTGTPDAEPSGFTLKQGGTNTPGAGIWFLWWKRITDAPNEPTSYSVDWPTANTASGWFEVIRFTGCKTSGDPFDSAGIAVSANSTNDATIELPAFTAAETEPLIVSIGGQTLVDTDFTMPGVASSVIENSGWPTGPRGYGMYSVQADSVSAQTMTMTTGTSQSLAWTFALVPDSTPVPGPDPDRIVVPRMTWMRV